MHSFSRVFGIFLLLAVSADAAPQPGRYAGTLKVTKRVFGVSTTTTVRAAAIVSDNGSLSVVVLTPPSPFPDGQSDAFQTTIAADGTCVIPRAPASPSSTSSSLIFASGSDGILGSIPYTHPTPEYHGGVRLTGSGFSLSYDDVPDVHRDANGNRVNVAYFIAPVPNAEFTFHFRRVNP